jgi:hypothetical protein
MYRKFASKKVNFIKIVAVMQKFFLDFAARTEAVGASRGKADS